ncbi:MAG: family 78 glycoside hydrolase catalytic domain [Clostridia bacterium]|nr:family 78 glycoside hydrolase catalytic domain [Clostridia bacterium]
MRPQKSAFSDATKLIWNPRETETYYDTPKNSYCLFRKEFQIISKVKSAKLKIFADSRYICTINGKRIGRGPCRSDPRWQYFDTYDIADQLISRKNILAVEVLYYGYGTGHSISRIPALFAECSLTFEDQTEATISSDKTWKTYLSESLDRTAPRVNGCKGCIEVWDMQRSLDFTSADFDDSLWDYAKERGVILSPFWNLYPKPIENLTETYVHCDRFIAKGTGKAEPMDTVSQMHKQIKQEFAHLEPRLLCVKDTAFSNATEGCFNYLVADFKQVLAGYLFIKLDGKAGDTVDVVFSEELLDGKPVFNNVSYRPFARFVLKDGENLLETKFNYEAFRYVYLLIRNSGRTELKDIGIVTRNYPIKEAASFHSRNEKLQKIWEISTHTLKLCMQDGFLDSSSREQQQWMGDGRFQAIMNYYYSGDCRLHEKLLLQIAQSQDMEGMTCSRYPDANHNWPPIPSFCLQWICSFGDYYAFTQKTELIALLWNSIISAMRWFSGFENEKGLLEKLPYWQYYDISKNEAGRNIDYSKYGVNALINLMYAEAMATVADLANVLNDKETERFFAKKLKRLNNCIKQTFWNSDAGAYSLFEEEMIFSEAVNALAITLLHHKEEERAVRIVETVFDPKTRSSEVYKVSPYFMIPFYRAMRKMARNDIALDETLDRYSAMIESGATSTWENWSLTPENRRDFMYSACHAWAASPIVLIAENLPKLKDFEFSFVTPYRRMMDEF